MEKKYYLKHLLSKTILKSQICCNILTSLKKDCKVYQVQSLYKYAKDNNCIIQMLDERESRSCRKGALTKEAFENPGGIETNEKSVSKSYITRLHNAYVRSDLDAVVVGKYYLTDMIEWDSKGMLQYPGNTVLAIDNKKCVLYDVTQGRRIEKGVCLLKRWSPNIFHLTFEVLARLCEIDALDDFDDYPLLMDYNVSLDSRSVEFIKKVNKKNREIIWIKYDEPVYVEELLIPPRLAWGLDDLKKRKDERYSWIIDKKASKNIRSAVMPRSVINREYDKVFVARGDNKRLVNESELIMYFEARGYSIFYPSNANYDEEVECFSTANVIVGCAGAAFTNIVYCKENACVVEICPLECQGESHYPMADSVNVNAFAICPEVVEKTDLNSLNTTTFRIEPDYCYKMVEMYWEQSREK